MLKTDNYGPWFARITYNEIRGGYDVILLCELDRKKYLKVTRLVDDYPYVPWNYRTLRGAKKKAKKELKRVRLAEHKAIILSEKLPIEIH